MRRGPPLGQVRLYIAPAQQSANPPAPASLLSLPGEVRLEIAPAQQPAPSPASLLSLRGKERLYIAPAQQPAPPPSPASLLLSLPEGVALHIVGWLPVQSVTALACTCRAARALTLTPSLWTTLYARDLVPRRSCHELHGIGTLGTLPAPLGPARCGRDSNATGGSFTRTHRLRDGDADSRSKYWQRLRARRVWVVAAAVVHQHAIDRARTQQRLNASQRPVLMLTTFMPMHVTILSAVASVALVMNYLVPPGTTATVRVGDIMVPPVIASVWLVASAAYTRFASHDMLRRGSTAAREEAREICLDHHHLLARASLCGRLQDRARRLDPLRSRLAGGQLGNEPPLTRIEVEAPLALSLTFLVAVVLFMGKGYGAPWPWWVGLLPLAAHAGVAVVWGRAVLPSAKWLAADSWLVVTLAVSATAVMACLEADGIAHFSSFVYSLPALATYCCVVWLFWVTWIKRHWVAFCLAVVAALGGVVTAHIIMWAEPDNIGEHIEDACIVTMVQLGYLSLLAITSCPRRMYIRAATQTSLAELQRARMMGTAHTHFAHRVAETRVPPLPKSVLQ